MSGWSGELEGQLDRAFAGSSLPEDRDRKPISEFLVRLRLGGYGPERSEP